MTESVLVFAVMASSSLLLLAWQRRPVLRLVLRLLRWRRDRVSAATNARAGVAIGQRLTQLTPTRVVKQQDPTVAVIEAEKTRRAAAIASMTELFDVPRLVGGTPTLAGSNSSGLSAWNRCGVGWSGAVVRLGVRWPSGPANPWR